MTLDIIKNRRVAHSKNSLDTFILSLDDEGRVDNRVANHTLRTRLGLELTQEDVENTTHLEDLLIRWGLTDLVDDYAELQKGKIENVEYHADVNSEKGVRHVHIKIEPTEFSGYTFMIGDLTDVTLEKRRVQKALEIYHRAIAEIGHDLKNPLMALSMVFGVLEGRVSEALESVVANGAKVVDSMITMTNEYLDLSRLQKGKYEPKVVNTDLYRLIEKANASVNPLLKEGNEIIFEGSERYIRPCDAGAVKQGYENIVSNAIKYGGKDAEITTTVTEDDKHVYISVKNTGSYLTRAEIRKILGDDSEFYRVERLATKAKGSGLGLHLVKEKLRYSGADLTITSDGKSYTKFTIKLKKDL